MLTRLTATAHPSGHRIDLSWGPPPDLPAGPAGRLGVRIVRREHTHPETPDDGTEVADALDLTSATDTGLHGERVYYYSLFTYTEADPTPTLDPHDRISALATAHYDFAGRMYALLPNVYRRYDAAGRSGPDPSAVVRGPDGVLQGPPLRRYLELPGAQLDQLYSLARAGLHLHDVQEAGGSVLPLLAQWIGWHTDHSRSVRAQRGEIRRATDIYRTVGAISAVEATVARVTGWRSRTKEYVHNVARTNTPERLNLWSVTRDAAGTWGRPELVSCNFSYAGGAAHAPDPDGGDLFVLHTHRRHGWDIWAKQLVDGTWQPSTPVVDRPGTDLAPTVVRRGDDLWLFWESYDDTAPAGQRHWRVLQRVRSGGVWSPISTIGDETTERRGPAAAADGDGGLWLFWREPTATGWQVRFNRHDGTHWQLDPPGTVPSGPADPVAVEDDLTAMVHPTLAGQRLWLFWAGHQPGGPPGQTRWTVGWRVKASTDPTVSDWSAVGAVPKASAADHEREPSPLPTPGGVELFRASTRTGGWSVVSDTLDAGPQVWTQQPSFGAGPFTRRAPTAVATAGGGALLTFRSNASIGYLRPTGDELISPTDADAAPPAGPGVPRTLDARYAGTTTVRVADTAKLGLRGGFDDVQSYTYQTGRAGLRTDSDRIARDTVGIFLDPAGTPARDVPAALTRLAGLLSEVLPVSTRSVLIVP